MTDADDMYSNWVTDPEVSRFWTWDPHENIKDTKKILTEWIGEYIKPDYYHWIIVLKEIMQAIGFIYFADIDNKECSLSVHYGLSRKYWNQGIITEACNRVIDFAFNDLGIDKIHTNHHVENPASGRIMQKCGMRHVDTAYMELAQKHLIGTVRLGGERHFYGITSFDYRSKM
jgi:ribosomal-protein-alanine N-acetyltransferase